VQSGKVVVGGGKVTKTPVSNSPKVSIIDSTHENAADLDEYD